MNISFTLPTSWDKLSIWQLRKIASFIHNDKEKDIKKLITTCLFFSKPSILNAIKFSYVIRNIPFSTLMEYGNFIYTENTRTKFPKKVRRWGRVLYGPADRLTNLTVEEYANADVWYYNWMIKKNINDLNRLVAVLYRPRAKNPNTADVRLPFDKNTLKFHAPLVQKLPLDFKLAVALAFQGCRERIIKLYGYIFTKSAKGEKGYRPFSEVIASMARSENQPFGDFYRTQKAMLYDFFDILNKEIKHQQELTKKFKK